MNDIKDALIHNIVFIFLFFITFLLIAYMCACVFMCVSVHFGGQGTTS